MVSAGIPVLSPRRRGWKIAAYLLGGLLLAGLCIVGWFFSLAKAALPQLDGKVIVPGLSSPVSVLRDAHGVPTIEAASLEDLFFAQGYVTAQDRLWQMDITRRYAAGELAEILGPELLKHDREQRILGMRVAARKAVEIASPQVRSHYQAYAHGVNAFIESHRASLPLEFRILRYSPRPWTPEDSALIAAQMVKDLSASPGQALVREKILARLGPELTADLYVNRSRHDRPPTVVPRNTPPQRHANGEDDDEDDSDPGMENSVTGNFATPPSALPFLFASSSAKGESEIDPPAIGSNNWVIAGSHTVSGKPLLSNDMHLHHQMPNLWYEAHLRCNDFDVAGVTLPGLPYVIVGHNQRIAWGFTNLGPTVEDAFIETFNRGGEYLTPEGWKTPEHRSEIIRVKGQPEERLDVTVTRHGPIVSSLIPGETRQVALRWTLYDGIHNPFIEVDEAQNWLQFRNAFSGLDAPAQNVVYADVDGNIGYQATGKIPIRAAGDGSLPENGSDGTHEWTGYIPFEKLPSIFNPESGILATANSRITPDGFPYSISTEWAAPWRSARIYRVLESGRKFSAADMLALQTDIDSEAERYFAEAFVSGVDRVKTASVRAREAADLLRQWDGRMSADSAAPTLETRARAELMRLLLEPKLGPAPNGSTLPDGTLTWKSYQWGMQLVWLENVLLNRPQRWLPASFASYDEVLAAAVEAAVSAPDAPRELAASGWGDSNAVTIQHPVLGKIPWLRHRTGPVEMPQSGDGFTVKAVTPNHGPSERMTIDLSNLDASTLNLVTGEAGNFGSPYYMDQWQAWYEGTTFVLPFSKAAVQKARTHALTLEPK